MTWREDDPFYTGESQGDACEQAPNSGASQIAATNAIAQTGNYCIGFPTTSASAKAWLRGSYHATAAAQYIDVLSGAFAVTAAPTTPIELVTSTTGATLPDVANSYYVTIGTDRKIRIYDGIGNQHGTASTTLIPLSSGGSMQEMHIVFDGLTLSTVYVKVYFGATEELAFNTGKVYEDFFAGGANRYLYWGEVPPSGRGATLYGDDLYMRRSDDSAEAPHLVRYPRFRGNGSIDATPPAANGDEPGWNEGTGTDDYNEVDETGGNDGDTSFIGETGNSVKELYHYTAASPIPADGGGAAYVPLKVQQRVVHRLTGASKVGHQFLHKFGGTEASTTPDEGQPSTDYVGGMLANLAKPGGGSWARADADLSGGNSKLQFGVITQSAGDIGSRVTLLPGPEWIYYDNTDANKLEVGTTPTAGAGGDRRRLAQFV